MPGDGIGPEVTEQARLVLVAAGKKVGLEFDFLEELIGGCSIDTHGTPLRDEVIEACRSITGRKIPDVVAPRRAGDPPELVADSSLAQETLA